MASFIHAHRFVVAATCGLLGLGGCSVSPSTTPPTSEEVRSVEPSLSLPPEESSPRPLHVVAVREGYLELRVGTRGPVLMLEGEPVPIVDGVPKRHPTAGANIEVAPLRDPFDAPTVAFYGDVTTPGHAWMTTAVHELRTFSDYDVVQRTATGWRPVVPPSSDPLLVAYFSAYVERGGAVLGLKQWTPDPRLDPSEYSGDGEDDTEPDPLTQALLRARPQWAWLAGKKVKVPRIPASSRPLTAVGTTDGTVVAIAQEGSDEQERTVLLVWPPGLLDAVRIEPPGVGDLNDPALSVVGDWVTVIGRDADDGYSAYLATGRGTEWEPVTLMPGFDGRLVAAARTPTGELWLATADRDATFTKQPLWRRPPGGDWEPVPMPTLGPSLFEQGEGWSYGPPPYEVGQGLWMQMERGPQAPDTFDVDDLVWHDGALWVIAQVGTTYRDDHGLEETPRSVLMTTAATDEVVTLPSASRLYLERYNRQEKDRDPLAGCRGTALLLGPAPEQLDALVERLSAVEVGGESLLQVYIGELDGTEQLVSIVGLREDALGPEFPTALARAVGEIMGRPPTLDCRVPRLVRMLEK